MREQDEAGSGLEDDASSTRGHGLDATRKRARESGTDRRYPRKRALKACHVCRARKTKCDNVQPTCGFCASIGVRCSFDEGEKDHSTFDAASLEILRQLGQIVTSQETLLQIVRSINSVQAHHVASDVASFTPGHVRQATFDQPQAAGGLEWSTTRTVYSPLSHRLDEQRDYNTAPLLSSTYIAQRQPDSASTTPAASGCAPAVRWFGLLASDAPSEILQDAELQFTFDGASLEISTVSDEDNITPLQSATRIVDKQRTALDNLPDRSKHLSNNGPSTQQTEEALWQAPEGISLLPLEQMFFENFLRRICPWLDLFDPACTFATSVPHLAIRNAGLMNAILALSCYHLSLVQTSNANERPDPNTALQYYYQTLHYVQKAMRYSTYQTSHELMATTLIVSTYEMLRESRRDWERHLQGVFWILRSRQINVEISGLESTTWWAWLRQDIWAAFREKRRTYTTWTPKKAYSELTAYEIASRAVWILAQVINFCAREPDTESQSAISTRSETARILQDMLHEWRSHLTTGFSPLPARDRQGSGGFQPLLIHPPCFGLAMQIHHVSQILILVHEPSNGGLELFIQRQKSVQQSVEVVCGIGMTLTDDASSLVSSQCLFIAGMFTRDDQQRKSILEMLDLCRQRCGWPTHPLGVELERTWDECYLPRNDVPL